MPLNFIICVAALVLAVRLKTKRERWVALGAYLIGFVHCMVFLAS